MKKKIVLFVLFIVLGAHVFADTMFLFPAMGMQTIHNIIPLELETESGIYSEGDSFYQYYIGKKPGSTDAGTSTEFDRIAIALTGFRADDRNESFNVNADKITVTVEYDGFFTSDENSVYVRPYLLYPLERTLNYGSTRSILCSVLEPGGDSFTYPSQDILSYSTGSGSNKRVWIDFILQLPGVEATDGSGINDGNTYYPLIEGTYSTEVTIKVEGPLGSDIITIPVVAQYEPDDNRTILDRSSEVSLDVSPTANAVNLNLSDMLMTGESVKIGTFSFMLRTATNSDNPNTDEEMDLSPNYSIFLSASPDPFSQENNGFMFVHEDYVVGESFYNEHNSVDFYVDVQGTGSTLGRNATFDGRDYADTSGNVNDTELLTKCNKETALAGGNNYIHYHTFEGDIALYVPRNTNSQLNAGRYQGDIYVHVISFEGE